MFSKLAKEPPFRVFVREALKLLPVSAKTRALWDLGPRPQYWIGLWAGAKEAKRTGVDSICAIEFGVAGGNGLVALEMAAAAIEAETGVKIRVYGFDNGPAGLPSGTGDYRDHPDWWKPGDFRMDVDALKKRLNGRTELVLGDVAETARTFKDHEPIGFVSFDLDLYSSTRDALEVLLGPKLLNVPLYFDDLDFLVNHRFAGELLAVEEFNLRHESIKIDRWYGVKGGRPFPEQPYLDKLYVAHDLAAITAYSLKRGNVDLALR